MSQAFVVSSIGAKMLMDANLQVGVRKETSGPLEETLQQILDIELGESNLVEMHFDLN